ncbi:hypothetical protein HY212_03500, partial [Candidatus Pacearchaeota archaeon]|nr:hypothetical protein [Candidatus Pacearchaeota archaeon]
MKKILFTNLIFLLISSPVLAYQWPIDNSPEKTFAKQQRITSTLGEYRKPSASQPLGHLHAGVDINPVEGTKIGTKVYAVEDGYIPLIYENKIVDDKEAKIPSINTIGDFSSLRVVSGNRIFNNLHIEPDDGLVKRWKAKEKISITTGQLIGTIKALSGDRIEDGGQGVVGGLKAHLHFEENGFKLNPDGKSYTMAPGAFNPLASLNYFDNAPTEVFPDSLQVLDNSRKVWDSTTNTYRFSEIKPLIDHQGNQNNYLTLPNQVSLNVKLKDSHPNNGSNCSAPYEYGYLVYTSNPTQDPSQGILKSSFTRFNTLEGKELGNIFDLDSSPETTCEGDVPTVSNRLTQELNTQDSVFQNHQIFQKDEDLFYYLVIMADDLTGVTD